MGRVVGVVAADLDAGAGLDRRHHGGRELEAHEVHGRGLLVVLAVQVFVGDGVDARLAFDLDEHAVFHADQAGQLALALVDVGVLDHHRGLPVAAVRHQRGIGVDLVLDALLFEDLLDAQHLLDLVADGGLALELQVDVLAQRHAAQLAVRDDLGLVRLAPLAVRLQRHEVVGGDLAGELHVVTITRSGLAQAVGHAHQGQRVLQLGRAQRVHFETLGDVMAAERAVGADVVGLGAFRVLAMVLNTGLPIFIAVWW